MQDLVARPDRQELVLLVAFADIHGYHRHALRVTDGELADTLDEHYVRVAECVTSRGGAVVKYIGDAALIAFEECHVDEGVECLLALKKTTDAWLRDRGCAGCQLNVKAHVGAVVAGPYGPPDQRRFDVIGKAVNTAARLPSPGVAISPQTFRRLTKATRARFKKHTPPVTYIRAEDPHRD